MMRKVARIVAMVLALSVWTTLSFAELPGITAQWNEYKSDHFIIYYYPGIPNSYIREFTRICEQYYHVIAERLGLRRFDYWSWENRATVFVYESRQDYVQERGRPQWSAASVHPKKKSIYTYYFEEDFFNTILPHELTHIVLREYIGYETMVPLWFEEGLACANEKGCYLKYLLAAKGFFDKGQYLAAPEMEKVQRLTSDLAAIFYPTAASLMIFLLEDYQKSDFAALCRQLRDGQGFYEAMDTAYGIKDAYGLNEKYLAFMQGKSYEDIATGGTVEVKW